MSLTQIMLLAVVIGGVTVVPLLLAYQWHLSRKERKDREKRYGTYRVLDASPSDAVPIPRSR